MKRTISFMTGKGSVNHNSRKFHAKNIESERSYLNVEYCNEDVKDVYHELFDEALVRYNEKQTRSDRKIDDYYDKICFGKQEKPFHEIILQIGDKDNMGATTENGQLAAKVLDEYMRDFQRRNPTLRVFSAYLHMDEATPHLHIDFVPYTTGSKRGLDTRVSLKQALSALGFKGGTRSETELNQWVQHEKKQLAEIMLERGIEWEQKGTHESIYQFWTLRKRNGQRKLRSWKRKKKVWKNIMLPYWKPVKSGWENWKILNRRFTPHRKFVRKQIKKQKWLRKKQHDMRKTGGDCSYGKGYGTICS